MWIWLAVTAIVIWLAAVTFFLFRTIGNYNRLTAGVSQKSLSQILNDFIDQQKLTAREFRELQLELQGVKKMGELHIQRLGLIRFNPFADMGGDQSFVLALLDGRDNGLVITSLYSRMGVRWYIKTVRDGKSVEHDFSKEEKEALKKAMKSS